MAMQIKGAVGDMHRLVLSPDALSFLEALVGEFVPKVAELRQRRALRRPLRFLPETAEVRSADWSVAPIPTDLLDRRVEITGPCDRKMVINALNSGANVFMADFEDSTSPTFENVVVGQANLRDAVRREIAFTSDEGKAYKLKEQPAVLFVRPRGWHLDEAHFLFEGKPSPGSLVDFGLFFFHNARELVARGTAPYFYLPKMQSHLEARLWNEVFVFAQRQLGLPAGTVRATCLVETLPAAFEMDEILFELRDHSAGLNCGRWDYIFSFIKTLADDPAKILPDRAQITMDKGFLRAYAQLLIRTCHRRNAHAMGGMAAQIPIKSDPAANEVALAKVRADKLREARDGHDGTWVAHPGLVAVAKEIFDREMPTPNQIHRKRPGAQPRTSIDLEVVEEDLLRPVEGTRTEAGLRHNIRVGVQYLEAWLRGVGCVPLYNLMEDAATAEICRSQIWQWVKYGVAVDGAPLTRDRFAEVMRAEMAGLKAALGAEYSAPARRFAEAEKLFARLSTADRFEEFLTLPAYQVLVQNEPDEGARQ
jgi:malate synthase